MSDHLVSFGRGVRSIVGCSALVVGALLSAAEERGDSKPEARAQSGGPSGVLDKFLPTAWQKHPEAHFNVTTEMTPEGRKRGAAAAERPVYYVGNPLRFALTGWAREAGTKPIPVTKLEETLQKELAANGYLPVSDAHPAADIVLFFAYGSHATDPNALASVDEASASGAEELVRYVVRDPALFRDVVERARFIAGDRFAADLKAAIDGEISNMKMNASAARAPAGSYYIKLPESPEFDSPLGMFLHSGNSDRVQYLTEMAFYTCYYVMASAYDYTAAQKGQKILLWRTRMTVDAQGFAMDEVVKPLIASAGVYLGRETPETVVLDRRIDREGTVEIGRTTVVEEAKPVKTEDKPAK